MEGPFIGILADVENFQHNTTGLILDEIKKEKGSITHKLAYGDFNKSELKQFRSFYTNQYGFLIMDQPSFTSGKNSTDMRLCCDVGMDLLHLIDIFVLVVSDNDYTPLVIKLQQKKKWVIGVGMQQTPIEFKNRCNKYIDIKLLESNDRMLSNKISTDDVNTRLILNAYEKLAKDDNDGAVNISTLKNLCVKLQPDFHTNGSWRNFLESSLKKYEPKFKANDSACFMRL